MHGPAESNGFSSTHLGPEPRIAVRIHTGQIEGTNEHHRRLSTCQAPLAMTPRRCFNTALKQCYGSLLRHALAELHILHEEPGTIAAQLQETAAPDEYALVARIAARAQRAPGDLPRDLLEHWARVIEAH